MDGVIWQWSGALAEGAAMTVGLALATLPFGLALGLAAALAKTSHIAAARGLAEAYTTIFRALPELLTLLLIYFGGQILLQKIAAATDLPVDVQVSPFVAGLVALALVFGAYSSEVILAALKAVERGQIEAARSFGMSPRQVFRRVRLPQMLRFALPGLGNNWLVLLKDTSLVSVIALSDLLRETTIAVQATREPFKFYAVACVIYLAMTALSTLAIARAERAAGRGFRSAR
ncbi:ABC transporter permease [Rhodomicrobium udaipurense JA643]|uniref:ABC transporter permease subunit n=1 Tax=Rhodomicrobium udaipurense TaxID=1202716 RepID=A0A8I1KLK1_9HYPH|nr:ABC transporter permease subunit [Rhodomicrobium udaipurense]KAI93985.1 ABC transporter permease [Rhodomicrobium udaipurense JA643]MBJ7543553.1 ABC transporter permease subunit [Rhodomicrobium udaipurense]